VEEYRPNEPYVIQSGNYEGKSLELLMFYQYPFLKWWIGKLNKTNPKDKNRLHRHLEWLIAQGENRQAVMLCPQCKQHPAKFFSSLGNERYGYSIYSTYTCCNSETCRERLFCQAAGPTPLLYPVKFSSITNYRKKFDQGMVVRLLKAVYKLPKPLTAQAAFNFFAK